MTLLPERWATHQLSMTLAHHPRNMRATLRLGRRGLTVLFRPSDALDMALAFSAGAFCTTVVLFVLLS